MSDCDNEYEVGYGRPPKASQFKKGQSGNPKGRPKGAKGIRASLQRELEAKVTIREGNRQIRVSKAEAMVKRLSSNALKGDMKALALLLKLDSEQGARQEADVAEREPTGSLDPADLDMLRHYLAAAGKPDATDDAPGGGQ
ncbi:DUF5681 domain-containing protein [Oceanomicrobium pacificus]|uniref:DUF5681 domain-containing protein n=1 Tax=Oceanomicrobium pacificus TaxID=2692916 RepID=A0A6B0TRK9_9RHOB|nr:DUF5681 domain-containing protein [Oceanomicrobium pacificus]MXU66596.1 hypothetical protein [Oceanomicrobium pacificus]